MTRWERIGYMTRWGRYLAEVEKKLILRGEEYAERTGTGVDAGCGGGRWSKLLTDRGWQMTCMDVNRADLAICERKIPTARCVLTLPESTSLPVASDSARIVLCIEVVPIIEADWFPAEASRVLQEGGVLVGVCINGQSLRGVASRLNNRLANGRSPYRYYQSSYTACRQRLESNGFKIVHEESCCWGPFGRESNSPFVPAFVKIERVLGLNRVISWGPWVGFIAQKQRAMSTA
jgi:ubiquinone/menaquinone biosynthesis C-methylase UbiE